VAEVRRLHRHQPDRGAGGHRHQHRQVRGQVGAPGRHHRQDQPRRHPEIVRQIRLRDLGGIIIIDFIDMDERKNRRR
jgi:hypothetical protein